METKPVRTKKKSPAETLNNQRETRAAKSSAAKTLVAVGSANAARPDIGNENVPPAVRSVRRKRINLEQLENPL